MSEFVEVQANSRSLSNRKPVYGVGDNDAFYFTQHKGRICPFYEAWRGMLKRCYEVQYQDRQPTYGSCTVVREWLIFSKFKTWMKTQDWRGKHLDKDIILAGNKLYGPALCVFVSQRINNLLTTCKSRRGAYPVGVSYIKRRGYFVATLSIGGRNKELGRFSTPERASALYLAEKRREIVRVANSQTDSRIRNGLLKHAELRCNV